MGIRGLTWTPWELRVVTGDGKTESMKKETRPEFEIVSEDATPSSMITMFLQPRTVMLMHTPRMRITRGFPSCASPEQSTIATL